jgi:hypothetical protein
MENQKLEKLKSLLQLVQNDTLTPKEVETFVTALMDVVNKSKSEMLTITKTEIENIQMLFEKLKQENDKTVANVLKGNDKLQKQTKDKITTQLLKIQAKVDEFVKQVPKDGYTPVKGIDYDDGYTPIKGVDYKDGENGSPDTGEEIVQKINDIETDDDEYKIDAKHIKNLPKEVAKNISNIAHNVYELQDVALSNLSNDEVLKWDDTNKRWVNGTGGGGGGVTSIGAGTYISVDNTNPAVPIVSSTLTPPDIFVKSQLTGGAAGTNCTDITGATQGDMCTVTAGATYVLTNNTPATAANWQILLSAAAPVSSVNGATGNVSLTAANGLNYATATRAELGGTLLHDTEVDLDSNYMAFLNGNTGFNMVPNEAVDVTGNVQFTGKLMPGGSSGTTGQVLTSAGTGTPTWTTPTSGWGLTGNSGTTVGTNYIGTSDNVALSFKTNGTEFMRAFTNQNVAIGTTTNSGYKLDVNGTVRVGSVGVITSPNAFNLFMGQAPAGGYGGLYNIVFGIGAAQSTTGGNENSYFGFQAGRDTTNGNNNVFSGTNSGLSNTTGSDNVFTGHTAGAANSTGSGNIFVGKGAGRYITGGATGNTVSTNSVFLGFNTKALASSQSNQIVIGYDATGLGSNTVTLGNDSITFTALKGNVGIGTTTDAGFKLDVTGTGIYRSTAITDKPLIVRGFSGQTANMQEWQDSASTALLSVSSAGTLKSYQATGAKTLLVHNRNDGEAAKIYTSDGYNLWLQGGNGGQLHLGNPGGGGVSHSTTVYGGELYYSHAFNSRNSLKIVGMVSGIGSGERYGGSTDSDFEVQITNHSITGGAATHAYCSGSIFRGTTLRGNSAAQTITDASTVRIDQAPTASTNATITNAWALHVVAGASKFGGPVQLPGYTVATLPTGKIGYEAYVTDALAPVALANVVGGGAVTVKVFYNGTNWIVQ